MGELAIRIRGRSNAGIARHLVVTESAVAKHINNIFAKLDLSTYRPIDLSTSDVNHRRVLVVLQFLGITGTDHHPDTGR